MIEQIKVWRAKCDKCGVFLDYGGEVGFECHETIKELHESLNEGDWDYKKNKKCFCESCRDLVNCSKLATFKKGKG